MSRSARCIFEMVHTLSIFDASVSELPMKCLRIYTTADGESHFDEVEIPTTARSIFPGIAPFELSVHYPSSRIRFTRIPSHVNEVGWHKVPERVLTVRLNGSAEYQTSDGETRHVPAGAFVLLEDTHGKGHISRQSKQEQIVIWITLPNGLDPPLS